MQHEERPHHKCDSCDMAFNDIFNENMMGVHNGENVITVVLKLIQYDI